MTPDPGEKLFRVRIEGSGGLRDINRADLPEVVAALVEAISGLLLNEVEMIHVYRVEEDQRCRT